MAVPSLGTTTCAQHAHTHTEKHMPRAQLATPWGHPVTPLPVLSWLWLYLGCTWAVGAQPGDPRVPRWDGGDKTPTRALLAGRWR